MKSRVVLVLMWMLVRVLVRVLMWVLVLVLGVRWIGMMETDVYPPHVPTPMWAPILQRDGPAVIWM